MQINYDEATITTTTNGSRYTRMGYEVRANDILIGYMFRIAHGWIVECKTTGARFTASTRRMGSKQLLDNNGMKY